MPSSMTPVDDAPVPQAIIDLARTKEAYLNLRFDQRPPMEFVSEEAKKRFIVEVQLAWPRDLVDAPVREYLRTLRPPLIVALHFQHVNPEITATAVVRLENIYWTNGGYPRLDFEKTRAFQEIYGTNNFWGGYMKAIAPVRGMFRLARRDPKGALFATLVTNRGYDVSR